MSRITMSQLRPLALSLALGLGAATGLAAAAQAGETYSYETDVWPQIQAQRAAATQAHLQEAQVQSPATVSDGSSVAPQQNTANSAVTTNELGERVDQTGIPLVQDRGAED
jgi:hypothetical protein